MKKRFASVFLAFAIAFTQTYPSLADSIDNASDKVSINQSSEDSKDMSDSSDKETVLSKEESKNLKGGNIYSDNDGQKLSPLLEDFKDNLKGEKIEAEKVVYFVEYNDAQDKQRVIEAIKKIQDTKVLYEYDIIFQGCSVETWPSNLDKLKLIKGVKSVERAGKLQPLMNNVRKIIGVEDAQNYLKTIKVNDIDPSFDGRGMLISHIDTGMDYRHRAMRIDDLAIPAMKIKNDGSDPFWVSNKVPHAFNYLNGGKDTIEKYDDGSTYYDPHGMHIAGILAGNDEQILVNENKGIKGVAPNAQLLSYKMYSDSSDTFAGDETMFHAFEDSIKLKADVSSISSGFTGTGLAGEKYWSAIRAMRKAGIPVFVATGNFATSASNSSWDRYANNALGMIDTGNVTRTAAHEDAIAVGSSRNTVVYFPKIKIGHLTYSQDSRQDFRYSQIGAFFDKTKFFDKNTKKNAGKYSFIYLGKCQDEDIKGHDLRNKIVVMDRIFSGDMKYAFKKVQDKGAKMVIVVNTVSYYNRDDWENVPAMGYEKDEKTSMQVISLSGYDGAQLWDMIKQPAKTQTTSAASKEYRIDMNSFNKRKPVVGQEASLDMEFSDELIEWKDVQIPTGSTSWGPRTDLMLKPDISAPGKNIYSTLNRRGNSSEFVDDYAYMSGTSMATPVAAGASVLIRPKLKKMVQSPVLNGIDLTSLTKIVMQNTASPMIDPTTAKQASECLFASPRQQGAGVINVERALRTDVTASFKVKDSVGLYNSYGAVSLKEIKGGSKDFTIDINNTGNKNAVFEIKAAPVTTDGEKQTTKLDEEYIDEEHKDGKQIVAEIHPVEVNGAKIIFKNLDKDGKITIPAKSSYQLNATIETGSAADGDKFVESFIKFISHTQDQPSLSMPLMGFAGNWNKEPIIDKWAWEEGSLSGKIVVFDDNGKPKRPGTLNYGAGGEHGVDNFHPAGVIQNTQDGNPEFKQDPQYFAMNTAVDFSTTKISDSKLISGNKKKITVVDQQGNEKQVDANDFEVNNTGLTPSPLVLRSAAESKIYIANEHGKNIRTMAVEHFVKGILNSKRNTAKGLKDGFKKVWGDLKWDGTVFNPHMVLNGGDIVGDLDQVAEGQYYYTFEYRLTPDYDWQKSTIPIRVDNTAPSIENIILNNIDNIVIKTKDTYHKAKDLSKAQNGVYFRKYQEEHPDDFEQVDANVWYVGAGFVDKNSGNVLKNLKVLRVADGEYVINDANQSLPSKVLEIVAVDGAGNYAPTQRVVFDDEIKDGKLGYTLFVYDATAKEFKKLNDGAVGGDFKKENTATLINPVNPNQGVKSEPDVSGAPSVSVDKNKSDLDNVKESRKVVPKEFKHVYKVLDHEDFTTGEIIPATTATVISIGEKCTMRDSDGNPKYYDIIEYDGKLLDPIVYGDSQPNLYWDNFKNEADVNEFAKNNSITLYPMEFEKITQEQLEKEGKFLIHLNDSDGFGVIGTLTNVDRNTKVYFQSKNMKQISKTRAKQVPTFGYDKDTHTMKFDFYGNRKDLDNGSDPFDYNGGEIYIWAVNNNGEKSNMLTLTMPDAKKPNEKADPLLLKDDYNVYTTMLHSIEELKGNGEGGGVAGGEKGRPTIVAQPTAKTVTNNDTKQTYNLFALKDKLAVNKGFAVRIISFNPGKMSTVALQDVIYAEDPAKMGSSEKTVFGKQSANGDYYIDIDILQGFNALRFEIYKPQVDSDGKFINVQRDADGNITGLSEKDLIFEKGRCVYFDKDPVTFDLDEDTFNPYIAESGMSELYTRTNPMTLRGRIGDKGGFMWHLRINHHIVDEYLIYGDLKIDNTKDFSFTTQVKDGDVLDWAVKDYSTNSFPEKKFKTLDGEITAQMPSQYRIYIDNKKPEIDIRTDNSISKPLYTISSPTTKNALTIEITDKIDSGEKGRLQETLVTLNDKILSKIDEHKEAEPTIDRPWIIYIKASDYAKNITVEKYMYDGKKLTKENTPAYKVTFDLNGGSGNLFADCNEIVVNQGENAFLPYPEHENITPPSGKEFDCWEMHSIRQKQGYSFEVKEDTVVKALWKDKKEQITVKFDTNGGKGSLNDVSLEKGENYFLPDGKYLLEKEGFVFDYWEIDGKHYQACEKTAFDKDVLIRAMWKEKDNGNKPQGGNTNNSGSGTGHTGGRGYTGNANSSNNNSAITTNGQSTAKPQQNSNNNKNIAQILSEKASDVDINSWAAPFIADVIQKGLMNGMGNGKFAPLKNITRDQMAAIIYNYKGNEMPTDKKIIPNVSDDKWYAKFVNYVVFKGFMIGYEDGTFRPENNITRAEFMYTIAKICDIKPLTDKESHDILIKYHDYEKIPVWAKNTIAAVVKSNIVKGDGQNINPNSFITRQEAAVILSKI